jgi:hypothetical protein
LGADYTYLSTVGEDEQETVKTVHSMLAGPPDITIDCSGAEANIRLAIFVNMTFNAFCAAHSHLTSFRCDSELVYLQTAFHDLF